MNASDFSRFFEALWSSPIKRYQPFPWQVALAKKVCERGWSTTIDLPTSAGKTTNIDIALFHLALEADNPQRKAPMRIYFVVDRRLVVDEAYNRAKLIQKKLVDAKDGILAEVAQRLSMLSSAEPLQVIRLRGGLPKEKVFIQNPLQPTIILSTVDQVGSRLLFRGYGVSRFARPIHAALVGTDSLIILDEAHLSRSFETTLDEVKGYQSDTWVDTPVAKPLTVVTMTATPLNRGGDVFSLTDEDWNNPVLSKRLMCSKIADLASIKGDKKDPDATSQLLVGTLVKYAKSLMGELCLTDSAPVVGVVVNWVATARHVFDQLRHEQDADAVLLTGRIRPIDRDALVNEYLKRFRADRSDGDNQKPLYVVATQTVEVGADLDFDALVTEAAALDALRQRFGRLGRFGKRPPYRAVIVYVNYGKDAKPDPIYGTALVETWNWMSQVAKDDKIDFGIQSMKELLPSDLTKMLTQVPSMCALMPAHMDMLVQTSIEPAVTPAIALYLHGKDTQPDDVQIVWRADITENMGLDAAIETLSALPPNQLEVLALPVRAARSFLTASREYAPISDVEGGKENDDWSTRSKTRHAVRWQDEDSVIVEAKDVKPGDILVVPSSYGGQDKFGWNPESLNAVLDIGDEAATMKRGIAVIRVHDSLIPQWFAADLIDSIAKANSILKSILARYNEGENMADLSGDLIAGLLNLPVNDDILMKLKKIQRGTPYPGGILLQQVPVKEASSEHEVLLETHSRDVAGLTSKFVSTMKPQKIFADIVQASKLHDLGKADPRFQASLWDGDPVIAKRSDKVLAKSTHKTDLPTIRRARQRAGYPKGTRHECYSVAMAHEASDLTKYLIGVSHGRGRALMPSVDDPGITMHFDLDGSFDFNGKHDLDQLSSGWIDHFWQLNRRYGYWGLAYLESMVRLADQTMSAQEESGDE